MNLLAAITDVSGGVRLKSGVRLLAPYAEAQHPLTPLGGQYRLRSVGIHVELELIEASTGARGAVYIREGEALFLFIQPGDYELYLRFLSPPADYADAQVIMERMTPLSRLAFAAAKGLSLLKRPLPEWKGVLRRALRGGKRGVTGAVLSRQAQSLAQDPPVTAVTPGPADPSGVSVIIPTKIHLHHLSACIESLEQTDHAMEVIVVDNGATAPDMVAYLAQLSEKKGVKVIRHDAPFNFSELCNLGARQVRFNALLFLNDDVEALDDHWLSTMMAHLNRENAGIVGARLLYPDGALQHAGVAVNLVPGPGHPWRGLARSDWQGRPLIETPIEVDAVTGACLLIRRDLFEAMGGFDEEAFIVTLNDIDLCLRARQKGFRVIYAPEATLIHKEGQSRPDDDDDREVPRRQAELKAFYERFGDMTRRSVFYPPNLRRDTDRGYVIPGL